MERFKKFKTDLDKEKVSKHGSQREIIDKNGIQVFYITKIKLLRYLIRTKCHI